MFTFPMQLIPNLGEIIPLPTQTNCQSRAIKVPNLKTYRVTNLIGTCKTSHSIDSKMKCTCVDSFSSAFLNEVIMS